jgi:5-methylcytosine-specific restriction endonuclease McrA
MTATLRTLVLTPWMAYHRIARWDQGVVAVVTGKVDVLESYEAICASPSISVPIPAVVRMLKLPSKKKSVRFSRPNVYARDDHRCCYCGKRFSERELTFDHVIPRSRGGKTDFENIVTSCSKHNLMKGDRTPAEAGMRMHFQPHTPTSAPMTTPRVLLGVGSIEPLWRPYLAGHAALAAG